MKNIGLSTAGAAPQQRSIAHLKSTVTAQTAGFSCGKKIANNFAAAENIGPGGSVKKHRKLFHGISGIPVISWYVPFCCL